MNYLHILAFILMSLLVDYKAFSLQSSSVEQQQRRRTEDVDSSYQEYDLSSFSIRFEKCQYVKMFDEEMVENNEEYDSVLAMKHFVVYKMCPKDECESCSNGVHGEYVVDLDDFLEEVVKVEQEEFENMCDNCNERCNNDGNYCNGCGQICWNWENLENNGYVDAANYIECQQVDIENDDDGQQQDDDDEKKYFVGPMCDNDKGVVIGLFSDENCWEPISDMDVEDVLGNKLSYHVFSSVTKTEDGGQQTCLSCVQQNDDDDNADDDAVDETNEMCEDIYAASGKCESPYGLENGFVNVNREENNFENQVENEFMTCTFINSLVWNSYTETGDINYAAEQDAVFTEVSALQAVTLVGLTATILGLAGFATYLYHKIEKFSRQTGVGAQGLIALGDKQVV